jgi:succinate dehydrogenase / fumarate reductase cytochrome b subunit
MSWFTQTFASSIGKKWIMAITGLGFCLFLAGHLAGNLSLFAGRDAFNAYAAHLHSLEPLVKVMEAGLILFAVLHIASGLVLFLQNRKARPVRYSVDKSGGGRTIGSRTMPYTGILILVFVVLHLIKFSFVDKTGTTIYDIVSSTFQSPIFVVWYVVMMVVAAVHISHGLWSAFQTLGANHPKYMPFIQKFGIAFSVVIGIGFGSLPIYLLSAV